MSEKTVGFVSVNGEGLKCVSFSDEAWENLGVGDIIYTTGVDKPVNFELTHQLPSLQLAPSYAHGVTVEFDVAEGGAVWLQCAVNGDAIAIRGPEAMRELARMLNAFADGYTGPLEGAK